MARSLVRKGLCEHRRDGFGQDLGLYAACYRSHQRAALPAGMFLSQKTIPSLFKDNPPLRGSCIRVTCLRCFLARDIRLCLQPGDGPIALMLAPTRELALQSHEVGLKYGQSSNIKLTCVYGGAPKNQQVHQKKNFSLSLSLTHTVFYPHTKDVHHSASRLLLRPSSGTLSAHTRRTPAWHVPKICRFMHMNRACAQISECLCVERKNSIISKNILSFQHTYLSDDHQSHSHLFSEDNTVICKYLSI
jgi:hypothetical protein